jgi:hypothetical protein
MRLVLLLVLVLVLVLALINLVGLLANAFVTNCHNP